MSFIQYCCIYSKQNVSQDDWVFTKNDVECNVV